MKKFASIFVSVLAACGLDPAAVPSAEISEITDDEQLAIAPRLTPRAELLTSIDCGTVIAMTDGEYLLNDIKQLEAIDSSACTYFAGNVRVAFTVPLVPTSQKYLFQPKSIRQVTGRIAQTGKTGPTTQLVQFAGLERAGTIESRNGQACPYPVLQQAQTIWLEKAGNACSFPALTDAEEITISGATQISGFNSLTRVGRLFISGGALSITGFKSLVNGGALNLAVDSSTANKWTGSFPALTTLLGLTMSRIDLTGFTLPKLVSVSNSIEFLGSKRYFAAIKMIKDIGGNLIVEEPIPYSDSTHIGPPNLETIGGNLTIKLGQGSASGYPKLQTIGGTLSVSCPGHVSEIRDFDALTTVGHIIFNVDATSIRGFSKLTTVNGVLRIVTKESMGGTTFDAFPLLTEIKGSVVLTQAGDIRTYFPILQTVGGDFNFKYDTISGSASGQCTFPKLESIGGTLASVRCTSGFNAVKTVGGSLSILDPAGYLGDYRLPGYKGVRSVGGDLILDKKFRVSGTEGMQRLLDQLTTLGGTVILK